MSSSITKSFLSRPVLSLSFLPSEKWVERGCTVGGTSPAALRPGFFRGGRTQVLLNALLVITSARDSPSGIAEGTRRLRVSDKEGRGAKDAGSESPITESGNISRTSIDRFRF